MDTLKCLRLAAAFAVSLFAAHAALAQGGAPSNLPLTDEKIQEWRKDAGSFEKMYKMGKKVADFCSNCHGPSGQSSRTDTPNLAGQNSAYAMQQLQKFTEGKRLNSFCGPLMKRLTPEEKFAVVIYYTNQDVQPLPLTDPALAARGKGTYDKICFKCHGAKGYGDEKYARIAGQQPEYLLTSIKRYRDGSVARSDEKMAKQTRSLTDDDVKALVAYIRSMP